VVVVVVVIGGHRETRETVNYELKIIDELEYSDDTRKKKNSARKSENPSKAQWEDD
jgi:hypothetical protein